MKAHELGNNPFTYVDEAVKAEAFKAVRGSEVKATKEYENNRKDLKNLFDEMGSDMDFSKISSLKDMGDGEKAQHITKLHSVMAGSAEAMREISSIKNSKAKDIDISRFTETGAIEADTESFISGGTGSLYNSFTNATDKEVFNLEDIAGNKAYEFNVNIDELFATTVQTGTGTGQMPPQVPTMPGIVLQPERPPSLVNVVPRTRITQNSVKYIEETKIPDARRPAARAEAAASNEMEFAYTEKTQAVESISGQVPVTEEALQDINILPDYINSRARQLALQNLDTQISTGNGSEPNLKGVTSLTTNNDVTVATTGTGASRKVSGVPLIQGIFAASMNIETTSYDNPNYVVIHPRAWGEALTANTSGIWQLSGPTSITTSVWAIPVIRSSAFASGVGAGAQTFGVVGNFRDHCRLYMRENVRIDLGWINDDFTKHIRRIRVSLRAAMVYTRASGFSLLKVAV